MRDTPATSGAAAGGDAGRATLWTAAAAVAGLGTWMLYDALPGLGWVLWTAAAAAGLLLFARRRGRLAPSAAVMSAAPVVIAGAAAVTATPGLWALIALAVAACLALDLLIAAGLSPRAVTARAAATAPFVALRTVLIEALRHGAAATRLIRSTRARAWVVGLAITLPVVVAFALLLAGADPVFAAWRDALGKILGGWAFVPRTAFFVTLFAVVLGAYAHAALGTASAPAPPGDAPRRRLGATERLILFAGVAALFWLFLAVQLGYLFGDLPRVPASGVTFAEYAHRGFGELTVVATASAGLILLSERYGMDDGRERPVRGLTFAVIAAVLLLLGSAFRRLLLYEDAYGFTTARLYAQVYMCAVGVGLVMLAREVAGEFDAGRLFRRSAAAVIVLFAALVYWNHAAWIANRNLDRFARTGKLDAAYLAKGLSLDAVPAIAARLPSLPEPARSELRRAVLARWAAPVEGRERAWYEWNLASRRARDALAAILAQDARHGIVSPMTPGDAE